MNQNQQNIEEHLLLQYLLGNADNELRNSVETWLDADSGNRQRLDRLESLWIETGKLSPAPVAVDVEAAWALMAGRIGCKDEKKALHEDGKILKMKPFRIILRVAAAVLLMVGMYGIFRMVTGTTAEIELASGASVLHDTLPDGTKVDLNINSKLVFPGKFEKGMREVKLTGEALFRVTRNAASPFVVNAGPVSVKVLGTTFSVRTQSATATGKGAGTPSAGSGPDMVEVKVTEGRVLLFTVDPQSHDTASLILIDGETGVWKTGNPMPVRTFLYSPDGIFWANRALDFRSTALSEVFALIEKYYRLKISVSDPQILDCRLTASFVNEPANRMITVIAESFGLTVETREQNFHLAGHGCNKAQN